MPEASLIVTIVQKGWADMVIEAAVKAGAQGSTIMFGRGSGIHERQKLLGILIEPEKEIVFTVVQSDKCDGILDEIIRAVNLNKIGVGIAFVVPLDKVVGVTHFAGQV